VVPEDQEQRHFHVHYLGLWDTVSSVGWVWDPARYPFTARNPSVHAARHAVSIDERRWFFRQNRLNKATPDQRIDEIWFPGVHSDIGGGYPQSDGALWREPFAWILAGAEAAGLKVDSARKAQILPPSPADATSTDPKHESLKGWWWPGECFPKWQWSSLRQHTRPAIGGGRFRTSWRKTCQSALVRSARMRLTDRKPRAAFIDAVRSHMFPPRRPTADSIGRNSESAWASSPPWLQSSRWR
jgi:hypothetical protein